MDIPRPEYPRPQFVRSTWYNLNGTWGFEFDPGLSGIARGLPQASSLAREILVPFCPESTLSGIGDVDFHPGAWYRRTFQVPEGWAGQRVLLHFGAVDHDTQVWINGTSVGWHRGGYTSFAFDITGALRAGENVVTVFASDDVRSPMQAGGKQCPDYYSRRCHYTRTTGIWQTVWLEPAPQTYVAHMRATPDLENGQVTLAFELAGEASKGTIQARALLHSDVVGEATVRFSGQYAQVTIPLREVEAWAPGSPTLYDLHLIVKAENGSVDTIDSYFGLRSISLANGAILLNGKPVFQRLILDQGFYPDGIYTAPSDEALCNDIAISQGMGFNGARLHQKVFEERFLYWADQMGYLVWGEFPNWGLDVSEPKALEVFLPQWLEEVRRDFNHPAIVGWCPFNETQRDQDPEVLRSVYRTTKAIDPTRPVIDTSGYQHVETDIYDIHNYTQDPEKFTALFAAFAQGGEPFRNRPDTDAPYGGQPYFVSEYGGIWWNPAQADEKGWGYGGVDARPRSEAEFLARYRALTEALLNHPKVCAFCYTQLTDVEQEVNGLYYYDRRQKFDPQLLREINTQPAAIEKA